MANYSINNPVWFSSYPKLAIVVSAASRSSDSATATCLMLNSTSCIPIDRKTSLAPLSHQKKSYIRLHLCSAKNIIHFSCPKSSLDGDSKTRDLSVKSTAESGVESLPIESKSIMQHNSTDFSITSPSKSESTVIIVGAGPSGLATAACLTLQSIPYILLEREDCCASLWKKKAYDRLHLHLPKDVCELPLMKFPPDYPKYVPREDFIKYLDNYVAHFRINPFYQSRVISARFDEGSKTWRVRVVNTAEGGVEEEYLGRFLVVATGETSDPYIPQIEGLSRFKGKVIHSTEYKTGKEYQGKNVLVVGAGNSGWEIALDLANHAAKTFIVVRSPVHVLAREMVNVGVFLVRFFPLNVVDTLIVMLSKTVYSNFEKYGLRRPQQGPFFLKITVGKFPIIDVGNYQKIKSGDIKVLPGIENIIGDEVVFEDGRSYAFDVIVFATGFARTTREWLQGGEDLLNEDGFVKQSFPNHWKGKNGLYCVGLAKRGLFGASMDAQNIAQEIKSHLSNTVSF